MTGSEAAALCEWVTEGKQPGEALREAAARFKAFASGREAERQVKLAAADLQIFDLDRANAGQHLSFGHGAHFCLGASLAREEMRAALVALSSRITGLLVAGTPPMPPVGSIYGPLALNLEFSWRSGTR